MPDSLNARMAAALAPAVGEAAVYVESPGFLIGDRNHPSVHYASMVPVNFADPAVGWGLWERWLSDSLSDVSITALSDGFDVEIIVDDGLGYEFYRRHDASLWGGVLGAWSAALGLEGSGDA